MDFQLRHIATVPLGALITSFDPKAAFTNGYGLFLSPTFLESAVYPAAIEEPSGGASLDVFEVESGYPPLFELRGRIETSGSSVQWWHIDRLRQKQPYGEAGSLLTNRKRNVFLRHHCSLEMYWWTGDTIPDGPEWHMSELCDERLTVGPHSLVFAIAEGTYDHMNL